MLAIQQHIKQIKMKKFLFKMFIATGQGQSFETGRIVIDARNADDARKLFFSKDLPFHHHSTIEVIK